MARLLTGEISEVKCLVLDLLCPFGRIVHCHILTLDTILNDIPTIDTNVIANCVLPIRC